MERIYIVHIFIQCHYSFFPHIIFVTKYGCPIFCNHTFFGLAVRCYFLLKDVSLAWCLEFTQYNIFTHVSTNIHTHINTENETHVEAFHGIRTRGVPGAPYVLLATRIKSSLVCYLNVVLPNIYV